MLKPDQIIQAFETQKVIKVKVYDLNDNLIFAIKDNEVLTSELIKRYKAMIPILEQSGKVRVDAVDKNQDNQSWKYCYSWHVNYMPEQSNQVFGMPENGKYVTNDFMMLQLQKQKLELEIESLKKQKEPKQEKDDPIMKYLPLAAKLLNWSGDDVKQIMLYNVMQKNPAAFMQMNAAGISGPPSGVKLTSEVESMTDEQKVAALETVISSIVSKCGFDKIYSLCMAINDKPALADVALSFLKSDKNG